MTEVTIVPFGSADHVATLALRRLVLRDREEPDFTPEEIERERGHVFFSVKVDGTIRGALGFSKLSERLVQLHQACVHPADRRRGYGWLLTRAVEDYARAQGYRVAGLYSRDEAVTFWTKMGYVGAADWFEGEGVPDGMMAKRL